MRSKGPRFVSVVFAIVLAAPCLPSALAMDVVKSAASMAQQALKAYEAGDHARAAQLYASAWRTNPAESAFLFAAARAEHVGGEIDMADEHYRAYLALTGTPDTLRTKAAAYLKEVGLARAQTKARAADKAVRSEDPGLGGQLYKAAYELAPERAEWLFKAAVCAQLTGDKAQAIAGFRDFLQRAPADAADRREAELRLGRLTAEAAPPRAETQQPAVAPVPAAPPPAPPAAAPPAVSTPATVAAATPAPTAAPGVRDQAPPPAPPSRLWRWVATGGAVALAGGALGLYLAQSSAAKQLNQDLAVTDAAGRITGISAEDAKAKDASIRAEKTASAVLGVATLGAAGVAVWLWLRPAATVAVLPDLQRPGLALTGSF